MNAATPQSPNPGYLDALSRELIAAGIRGRTQARIRAEIADHLECDPDARLGSPGELAAQFADELGTTLARRGVVRSFAALALTGLLMFGVFAAARIAGDYPRRMHLHTVWFAYVAAVIAIVAPQVALIAGSLAVARALRLRGERVLVRGQATIITRRACTAVIAGLLTVSALAVLTLEVAAGAPHWLKVVALAAAGAGALALAAALPAAVAATRVRPVAAGAGGDLFEDLGAFVPRQLRGRPWRFALAIATAVAIAIALAGLMASDPFDGIFRGLADAAACLAGFAVLGRYLGLRA